MSSDPGLPRLERDIWRPGHALDPAGDEDVAFAGANRVRRARHGLKSGATEAVHRLSRHFHREPREQRRHARDVAVVFSRLVGAAEDHVLDPIGRHARAVNDSANRAGGKVVGAHLR